MRNKICQQGFVSEPGDGVNISGLGSNMGYLTQSASGEIGIFTAVTAAITPRYEFHDHGGIQYIPDNDTWVTMSINNGNDYYDGGLATWNTATSKFTSEALGKVYTLRLTGWTESTGGGGTGIIQIALALSGASAPTFVKDYNRLKQTYEFQSRNNLDHIHISANYILFTDVPVYVSGAQFYMNTTIAAGIQLVSASLMIKEG
jgi:hypothetical protein